MPQKSRSAGKEAGAAVAEDEKALWLMLNMNETSCHAYVELYTLMFGEPRSTVGFRVEASIFLFSFFHFEDCSFCAASKLQNLVLLMRLWTKKICVFFEGPRETEHIFEGLAHELTDWLRKLQKFKYSK